VLVSEAGKTPLRVPVYAAAKPTSSTTASVTTSRTGSALKISGRGVEQGSGSTAFDSLASVLTLGASSPKERLCTGAQTSGCLGTGSDASADLRYVGAGSTTSASGTGYADGWLYFGVDMWGQGATIGHGTLPYVSIDVNGDGTPDYEVDATYYTATDVPVAELFDLKSGDLIDVEPINVNWGDVDTNVFDTDTLLIPVWPAAIGVTDTTKSFPISYRVSTQSYYVSGLVDQSPLVKYDVVKPGVSVAAPLYQDVAGTTIPFTAQPGAQALVLHLHGAAGQRAQVVPLGGKKH
jgi:hypothetical protein